MMNMDSPSPTETVITLVILDDNLSVRLGLRVQLDQPDLRILAACDSLEAFMTEIEAHPPNVAIIDLSIPPDLEAGMTAIERVRRVSPATRCIVYTHYDSLENFDRVIRLGIKAFVSKEIKEKMPLGDIIRIVARGGTYYEPDIFEKYIETVESPRAGHAQEADIESRLVALHITDRELEVLELLDQGLDQAQIAKKLVISKFTVKAHTKSLREKLQATSTQEALRMARLRGVL